MKQFIFFLSLFIMPSLMLADVSIESAYGYQNCIKISNKTTVVIINPTVGARVLEYSINGQNIIQVDSAQFGWTYQGTPPPNQHLSGGRLDIGPSKFRANSRLHWFARWNYEIKDDFTVKLTSPEDTIHGVQLSRIFQLDKRSSQLIITQKIKNISSEKARWAHWSRTFVKSGGTAIMPINPNSKYPKGFAIYGTNKQVFFNPKEEENVKIINGNLHVTGPFSQKKIDMDLSMGRVEYQVDDLMFRKRFDVNPDWVYGDITGANFSLWYNGMDMVEIEPIGPWEWVDPQREISYKEEWTLVQLPATAKNKSKTIPAEAFSYPVEGYAPAYYDKGRQALAVNSIKYPDTPAAAKWIFTQSTGKYDLSLTTLLETDGESEYELWVNNRLIGKVKNKESKTDYQPYETRWEDIELEYGDNIRVTFLANTNGKIPEGEGAALSRGRWTQVTITSYKWSTLFKGH
ncbi:hypothetical protein [Reichenbachiella ulvae]|uniref:Glycosyl hydrolases family 2, sugar binding domain n=1 Tax=Reichenbachiella ulvae TaxID=2980104 RepID=A0ABT3D0D1_9BACT|nr:hypothetical protein [Reichenbachiella ulvae]MCV9389274.1 hypothetical protein [Reichenbachiella ulvae]